MAKIKHKGPGLNTIGRGIQTSIILTKADANILWPNFNQDNDDNNKYLDDLFAWITTECRYSLLQGQMIFTEMKHPTTLVFDVTNERVVNLRLQVRTTLGAKQMFEVNIHHDEFTDSNDFEFEQMHLDEDMVVTFINADHDLDKDVIPSVREREQRLQRAKDRVINSVKILKKNGMMTRDRMHEVITEVNRWLTCPLPPENDPSLERQEDEELRFWAIRDGFVKERRLIEATEEIIDKASFRLIFNSYVFLMAAMRRFVDTPPQEVAGQTKDHIIGEHKISTTYKYNGVVNLMDNRVLKLTTTSAEKREFIRHIGRWLVRGHWRTYKESGRTIWIDQYEKGKEGTELEDRIYVGLKL